MESWVQEDETTELLTVNVFGWQHGGGTFVPNVPATQNIWDKYSTILSDGLP